MTQSKVYRISAITPEEGRVVYETMDEAYARRVHSSLLSRQLSENDFTHDVKVELV